MMSTGRIPNGERPRIADRAPAAEGPELSAPAAAQRASDEAAEGQASASPAMEPRLEMRGAVQARGSC